MTQRDKIIALCVAYEQLARALDAIIRDAPPTEVMPGFVADREMAWAGTTACRRVLERMPPPC
jgi:hypothetical protein